MQKNSSLEQREGGQTMYIKFLIGSIIFAGICFACGYRVCYLRMSRTVDVLRAYLDNMKKLMRSHLEDSE